MGTGAPLKTPSKPYTFHSMTSDLAASLLNRATNGAELLSILDSITSQVEQENIADAADHFASLQEVQF